MLRGLHGGGPSGGIGGSGEGGGYEGGGPSGGIVGGGEGGGYEGGGPSGGIVGGGEGGGYEGGGPSGGQHSAFLLGRSLQAQYAAWGMSGQGSFSQSQIPGYDKRYEQVQSIPLNGVRGGGGEGGNASS